MQSLAGYNAQRVRNTVSAQSTSKSRIVFCNNFFEPELENNASNRFKNQTFDIKTKYISKRAPFSNLKNFDNKPNYTRKTIDFDVI